MFLRALGIAKATSALPSLAQFGIRDTNLGDKLTNVA